jgi:hypothetical protein
MDRAAVGEWTTLAVSEPASSSTHLSASRKTCFFHNLPTCTHSVNTQLRREDFAGSNVSRPLTCTSVLRDQPGGYSAQIVVFRGRGNSCVTQVVPIRSHLPVRRCWASSGLTELSIASGARGGGRVRAGCEGALVAWRRHTARASIMHAYTAKRSSVDVVLECSDGHEQPSRLRQDDTPDKDVCRWREQRTCLAFMSGRLQRRWHDDEAQTANLEDREHQHIQLKNFTFRTSVRKGASMEHRGPWTARKERGCQRTASITFSNHDDALCNSTYITARPLLGNTPNTSIGEDLSSMPLRIHTDVDTGTGADVGTAASLNADVDGVADSIL